MALTKSKTDFNKVSCFQKLFCICLKKSIATRVKILSQVHEQMSMNNIELVWLRFTDEGKYIFNV